MTTRLTAILIAVLDAVGLGLAAFNLLITDGDPVTRGLDQLGGYSITVLFVLTGLPALVLAGTKRAPRLALGLALAFPGSWCYWPRRRRCCPRTVSSGGELGRRGLTCAASADG